MILLADYQYPAKLNFSSTGIAKDYQSSRLGLYQMMDGDCSNGRPVWKKGSDYLFYDVNFWIIGPNYNESSGGIKTARSGLSEIPQNGWQATYNDTWLDDPELNVLFTCSPALFCFCVSSSPS